MSRFNRESYEKELREFRHVIDTVPIVGIRLEGAAPVDHRFLGRQGPTSSSSGTWPEGEPQSVRDAYDAMIGGRRYLHRPLRRLRRPRHRQRPDVLDVQGLRLAHHIEVVQARRPPIRGGRRPSHVTADSRLS